MNDLGWLYIVVRTFPFWGIPTAATLFLVAIKMKPKHKTARNFKILYLVFSTILFIASGLYIYFQGHKKSVLFLHDILNSEIPATPDD